METLLIKVILDFAMAALLVVTIVYCVKLNKRIYELNDSRAELTAMIRRFDEATDRARATIAELQQSSKQLADKLGSRIEKANYMAEDLSFMIEKGSKLADQMEGGLRSRREETAGRAVPAASETDGGRMPARMRQREVQPAAPQQAAPQPQRATPSVRMRSRAEQELLDAVKGNKG